MSGVLDEVADDWGIYLNEMKGFYSSTLKQDNKMQFTFSMCLSFIDIGGMSCMFS